ncbi:MAG: DUF948 domain-containing protein [Actinobacteria bacterium]|nr:DUF948 domain-containing protein [Actinomycetota bacterium]
MALKILQVVGAVAVLLLVIFLILVLLRLRRTLDEVSHIVSETRPQASMFLKKAQITLDGVNRELENIEAITKETEVLVERVGDASRAVEGAIKSPLTKVGLITTGVAATGIAVRKRLSKEISDRK